MERGYSWSFVPFQAVIVSTLNFQPTEQPTRTENNPTDFCGGTAQLDPKTGVPSRGQRVLWTQRMNFHANIPQGKPQSRRCEPSKSHLRGTSRSYDIAIAVRRRLLNFYDISSTNLSEIYRQSLVRRPVFSLVRLLVRRWTYRAAPAAGESFGAHIGHIPCSLCHLMTSYVHPYPHGPPANVATLPAPTNRTYSRSKWAIGSG